MKYKTDHLFWLGFHEFCYMCSCADFPSFYHSRIDGIVIPY